MDRRATNTRRTARRARFIAIEQRAAGELPCADYPLYFTADRYEEHDNSGAQRRRVAELNDAKPKLQNPQARSRGSNLHARLKVAGVEVASMGIAEPVSNTDVEPTLSRQ